MESRDHLSGLRAVGSAVLAAYVCCASLAGMAGTHLDVPPSVHADGESMLSGGVPAGTSGQSRKVRLEAWCVNAGTNQFEVQFASSPAATAETVEFVLGFDCGVWFARGPALASREEFPGLPVPEGEFQLRLDIRLAPDGSPFSARLDAGGAALPALALRARRSSPGTWRGVRAFSRRLASDGPSVSVDVLDDGLFMRIR